MQNISTKVFPEKRNKKKSNGLHKNYKGKPKNRRGKSYSQHNWQASACTSILEGFEKY